jgi:mono/diheme cytochrome c family protein
LKDQLPPPEPQVTIPTLTGAPTYDNYINALFTVKCSACHGDLATAGLNLLTYETAMKGGKDGAVILPGDSANSILFKIQSVGNHFANLSSEELDIVKQWIDAGAPQK